MSSSMSARRKTALTLLPFTVKTIFTPLPPGGLPCKNDRDDRRKFCKEPPKGTRISISRRAPPPHTHPSHEEQNFPYPSPLRLFLFLKSTPLVMIPPPLLSLMGRTRSPPLPHCYSPRLPGKKDAEILQGWVVNLSETEGVTKVQAQSHSKRWRITFTIPCI